MATGKYKDTNFGQLVRQVISNRKFGFADVAPYAPSNGAPAAFIAQPVFNQAGEVEIVVALQFPFDEINEIMGVTTGMGETGNLYLVGRDADGKISFRSDMTSLKPEYVVGYDITTPYIEKAMEKTNALGHDIFTDSLGNRVIIAYSSIEVFGENWAMIGKIDEVEALATAHAIKETGIRQPRRWYHEASEWPLS